MTATVFFKREPVITYWKGSPSVQRGVFWQKKECLATVGLADVIRQLGKKWAWQFLLYFCIKALNHQNKKESCIKITCVVFYSCKKNVSNCLCFQVQKFHTFRQDVFCVFFTQPSTDAVLMQKEEKQGWFSDVDHVSLIRSWFEVCPCLGSQSKSGPPEYGFSLRKMWIPSSYLSAPLQLPDLPGLCNLGMSCLLFGSANQMQQAKEWETNHGLYKKRVCYWCGGWR